VTSTVDSQFLPFTQGIPWILPSTRWFCNQATQNGTVQQGNLPPYKFSGQPFLTPAWEGAKSTQPVEKEAVLLRLGVLYMGGLLFSDVVDTFSI